MRNAGKRVKTVTVCNTLWGNLNIPLNIRQLYYVAKPNGALRIVIAKREREGRIGPANSQSCQRSITGVFGRMVKNRVHFRKFC